MAPRGSVALVIVIVGHPEMAEEMVEWAVLWDVRQPGYAIRAVVVDLVGVAELDLDRDDRRLHPVDNVGEGGRARRGLSARGGGVDRRDRGFERNAAKGRKRNSAEKRRTEGKGSNKRHQIRAPSIEIIAAETVPRRLTITTMRPSA